MNDKLWKIWLPMALIFTILISMTIGRYPISLSEIGSYFATMLGVGALESERYALLGNVLIEIRLPRILAAVLIGAALSASGAAFQAVFRNPLVSPGLLGVLAGASFGAALAMLFAKHWFFVQLSAFAFGLLAAAVAMGIARIHRNQSIVMIMLAGVISGALFTSLLSIVKYLADPFNQLPAIVYWLMGSLANADFGTLMALSVPMLTGILVLTLLGKHMNVLSMGDEEARALGINVERVRLIIIFWATLISALTVVIAGMIGWIGLIIPHVARLMVGQNNDHLLPASALIGAIFLLLVDDISRSLFGVEIPIGIITELLGVAVFVVVLRNIAKGWQS